MRVYTRPDSKPYQQVPFMFRASAIACLLTLAGLGGCATTIDQPEPVRAKVSPWGKYSVAGSRIPRERDANGNPMTGAPVAIITDEQLRDASGILLGEKLGGTYGR